jgi:diguanylate cyclase (GGDEF)-like protein
MKIKTILFAIFLCLALAFSFFISHRSYGEVNRLKIEALRANVRDIAASVALSVDADQHSFLKAQDDMKTEAYASIRGKLEKFIELYPGVKHIYTFVRSDRPSVWQYVVDAEGIIPIGAEWTIINTPELDKAFGKPMADREMRNDELGAYISAYAPLVNSQKQSVGVLRLDMVVEPDSEVYPEAFFNFKSRIFPIFAASILFAFLATFAVSSLVSIPLDQILHLTNFISKGKYNTASSSQHPGKKDEVGALRVSVSEMSRNIGDKIEKLNTLNRTAAALALTTEPEEALKIAINLSMEIVGATKGLILLYNKGENVFSVGTSSGLKTMKVVGEELFVEMDKFSLKPDDNFIDYITANPGIYMLSEIENTPQLTQASDWLRKTGNTLLASLMIKQNLRGFILLDALVNDKEFLSTLVNQISMCIENARLYHDAIIDGLTGLYVSRYFEIQLSSEIRRSQRYGKKISILTINIDRFKEFNEQNGHLAGNFVLKEVASIIKLMTRTVDIIARYGGAGVAIMLPETDIKGAGVIAEKIRSKIEEYKFVYMAKSFNITVSAGIAQWSVENPVDAETLLAWADEALQNAQKSGHNKVMEFDI